MSEEWKTGVKAEGTGHEEDANMLDEAERPTHGSWMRVKKAYTYLSEVEKVTWVMRPRKHDEEMHVDVRVDSDWATRPEGKSTSGGVRMVNGRAVKQSRTQATRALRR